MVSVITRERTVGQHHSGRRPELRPARREAAALRVGPFTRHQHRAAPFATDPDPLERRVRRPAAPAPQIPILFVAGDQADHHCRDAHQHQRGDQRDFAADAIAEMTEQRRAERTGRESDEVGRERQ